MNSLLLSLALGVCLLGGDAVDSADPGASSSSLPDDAYLLLKNGRILTGQVTRDENRYRVTLPNGEISLRADDVTAVCRDLHEAYQQRLATGKLQDIDHRLRTAVWCSDQGLFEYGLAELEAARALAPDDRRLGYVERRLTLAQSPKPGAPTVTAEPTAEKRDVVSHEELDRLVRNLPKGTPETFAEVVQPLLVNRCGTSNCHGIASNLPLRLLRLPSNKTQASRITQRNLHAVLQFVDHQAPEQSALLKAAGSPHAGNPMPLLNESQHAHLTQLAEWISQVTETKRLDQTVNAQPATINLSRPSAWPATQLNQLQRSPVRRGWANSVQPAGFHEPVDHQLPVGDMPQQFAPPPIQRPGELGPQHGAPAVSDEHDPAEFNRRYFGDAPSEE